MSTATLKTLTPRQKSIYDYLCKCITNYGMAPTVRQIGAEFGINSPNGVLCHLTSLEKKGYITRVANSSRGIQLRQLPDQLNKIEKLMEECNGNLDAAITQYLRTEATPMFCNSLQTALEKYQPQ